MPVQAIDLHAARPRATDVRQVVGQGGAGLGGHFQDARFAKAGVDGVGRAQQLQGGAHAHRREVFGFDFGGANDKYIVGFGRDVDGVAWVHQAGRARQLHARRVQANDLAAHTAQH